MSDNFTVKHYADTIKKYIEAGYAFDDMLGGQTKSGSKSTRSMLMQLQA